jgi:hypothetical protein
VRLSEYDTFSGFIKRTSLIQNLSLKLEAKTSLWSAWMLSQPTSYYMPIHTLANQKLLIIKQNELAYLGHKPTTRYL